MIRKVLVFILAAWVLQGCSFSASGTWENDHIDQQKRAQIKVLNDKLLKAIANDDVPVVRSMLSGDLLKTGVTDLDSLVRKMSPGFKTDTYKILGEYNVRNLVTGGVNNVESGKGDSSYTITFKALNKESYVSLWLPEAKELDNQILVTAIYGKVGEEWKINILLFGQYNLFRKTALDYYQLAKASYDRSSLIDAVDYIGLAKTCLRPANEIFRYQKDKEITAFYNRVMWEAKGKYQLPLILERVSTHPKILGIHPQMMSEGFFPMVDYLTSIPIADTTALKAENENIKKQMPLLFTGINQDKKYVFYRAFNQMPDDKTPSDYYGFIDQRIK